ncbi:tubulin-specific chaperone A-like [Varroa jacobsoni]|uniref:Tubulin-specific chaperone A n=1 Tax=Varroa destructor TaxID=109461 RepID=A0A7M7JPR9_VARDE|nr:tubulin-specific chaperone A-like [Varroa destructor]XP_022694252.1 tubulin-specific chaperone A-like [Varroa jacobsoni]
MSTKPDPRLRTIKIKSGIVKRLSKEVVAYEKESVREEERLAKMKQEGQEDSRIKLQEKVIQESRMMIPDCRKRLHAAWDELKVILDAEPDLVNNEDFIAARTILGEVQPQVAH